MQHHRAGSQRQKHSKDFSKTIQIILITTFVVFLIIIMLIGFSFGPKYASKCKAFNPFSNTFQVNKL